MQSINAFYGPQPTANAFNDATVKVRKNWKTNRENG